MEWDCCLYILVLQHRYDSKDSHLVLGIFDPHIIGGEEPMKTAPSVTSFLTLSAKLLYALALVLFISYVVMKRGPFL